ncbi:MAG: hypothetical protein ACRC2M_14165, partial [Planktothrix sp.]
MEEIKEIEVVERSNTPPWSSVKFGVNNYQKMNKEWEMKVNILEGVNKELSHELENIKILYNKRVVEGMSESNEILEKSREWEKKYK